MHVAQQKERKQNLQRDALYLSERNSVREEPPCRCYWKRRLPIDMKNKDLLTLVHCTNDFEKALDENEAQCNDQNTHG